MGQGQLVSMLVVISGPMVTFSHRLLPLLPHTRPPRVRTGNPSRRTSVPLLSACDIFACDDMKMLTGPDLQACVDRIMRQMADFYDSSQTSVVRQNTKVTEQDIAHAACYVWSSAFAVPIYSVCNPNCRTVSLVFVHTPAKSTPQAISFECAVGTFPNSSGRCGSRR